MVEELPPIKPSIDLDSAEETRSKFHKFTDFTPYSKRNSS